jgi:phage recombination protein Bet
MTTSEKQLQNSKVVPPNTSVISSLDLLTTKEVTQVHLNALKNVAQGANNDELIWFAYFCNRYQLDPFTNQVYFILRRQKVKDGDKEEWIRKPTILIGIEGRLAIAERTGSFAGLSTTLVRDAGGKLLGAKCVGKKKVNGEIIEFEEEVSINEFSQDNSMWRKMPENMIKKCAKNAVMKVAWPLSAEYQDSVELAEDGIPMVKDVTPIAPAESIAPHAPLTASPAAAEETLVVEAMTTKEQKDLPKAAGFKWTPAVSKWLKSVTRSELEKGFGFPVQEHK